MAIQMSKEMQDAMARSKDLMSGYARSIGFLCLEWANLDEAVDHLLVPLSNTVAEYNSNTLGNMDRIGERLEKVKWAAFNAELSEEWLSWLNGVAHRIDYEFRPMRNRYVHDCARLKDWEFVRTEKPNNAVQGRARQPEQLALKSEAKVSIADIDRLTLCIRSVTFAMGIATHELVQWRLSGNPPFFRQELANAADWGAHLEKVPFFVLLASGPINIQWVNDLTS
ncbi:MAG: hypothetical protein ACK5WH_01150 [Hyphomonadaceae bacterium]